MNRYADPTACPGCRSAIEYGAPTCPHCDLRLTGQTAQILYTTLVRADQLVDELRRPVAVPAGSVPTSQADVPTPTSPAPANKLTSTSIPKILLGLGALCLLVAALVFLAVAWSAMGMGGRTAVLVGLTATAAVLCGWLSTQGLRAGAESFAAVGLGLLTLDVFGADSANWLGDISRPDFAILLGVVVGLTATAAAAAGLRSPVERLVTAELAAALGLMLVVGGWVSADHLGRPASFVAGTLLSAASAFAAWRFRLVFLSVATAASAALWWLNLLSDGLVRGLAEPTVASLWGQFQIWPVLAAAVLAAVPAFVVRLPMFVRIASAGVGLTVLAVAAGLPTAGNSLTVAAAVVLAVLAVAVGTTAVAPGHWGWSAAGALTLSAMVAFGVLALLFSQAAVRLLADPWSVAADGRLGGATPHASPLLVLPAALLLVGAAWSTRRLIGAAPDLHGWVIPVVGVMAVGIAGTLALYPVQRWTVVVTLLVGAGIAWALTRERLLDHGVTTVVAATALATALPSDWLTAASLLVLTGLAFAIDYSNDGGLRRVAGAASMVLLGSLLWTGGHLALMPVAWLPVLVIATLGLIAVARPITAYELAAAPTAVVAIIAAEPDLTWLAVHLTVAGALVTASGLRKRRSELRWIGAGVLFLATWVRLADLDVTTVEAYTLPLAMALLGFGLYRMYHDDTDTLAALSPGLGLAIVPSLLQALVDPVATRALLVGLACAVLVVAGSSLRWSAPLLIGAAAGLLLVLREATYAQVLPQWVLIGLIGALLTVIGVTWERRLQELRLAAGYVRGLR
jgi:hypothetical protein